VAYKSKGDEQFKIEQIFIKVLGIKKCEIERHSYSHLNGMLYKHPDSKAFSHKE
tara:strand:- start:15668 stop:15829 length:162 start_codon:yes stop_codon:yes gene_type:complete